MTITYPTTSFGTATLALTQRWLWRLKRQPMSIFVSLVQPAIWLVLFGNLFQNNTIVSDHSYIAFMTAGVIIMTVFNGAMNGGTELLFDKENGMLRRLTATPIPRLSIILSRVVYVLALTLLQCAIIMLTAALFGVTYVTGLVGLLVILLTGVFFGIGVTALSMVLVFSLNDHGQFFTILEFVSLPIIFASTALVPLSSMPGWLQVVARLNPMTYAINNVRELVLIGFNGSLIILTAAFLMVFDVVCLALCLRAMRRAVE